jgi:hypothetical protein
VDNGGFPGLYDPDRGKTLSDPSRPVLNLNDGKTILPTSERYDPALQELAQVRNSGYEVFNSTIDHAPHGGPHIDINGKMLDFKTAALDPLFWVHHCNIDRLWAEYSNDPVRPRQFSQLAPGMTFGFFDQQGQPVSYSYKEAAKAIYRLDYSYDTGASTLSPGNANQPAKTSHYVHKQTFKQTLNELEGEGIILQSTQFAPEISKKARSILSMTLKSCHSSTGHIDILIGDGHGSDYDAITNFTFDELKKAGKGKFLDQHYAGSINFLAHSDDTAIGRSRSHGHRGTKSCGDKQTYLFDITNELKASGRMSTDPLSITFNIDPDQNNPGSLKDIILSSAALYNLF